MFHFSYIDTIMEDAYMKDAIMEVANFRICVIRICPFMEAIVRICVVCKCTYTKGAYTNDAYTEGAYMEEIYDNPNAFSVYVFFHICAFKEVIVRKHTFIRAFICVVCICACTDACIYGRCHYGSGQLPYMRRSYAHIWKSAYTEGAYMEEI